MGNEPIREEKTPLFDDPDKPRNAIISAAIAGATVYQAHFPPKPALWERAKELRRADLWALAGWGGSDKFDDWSGQELNVLATAISMHLNGKPYTGMKYGVCSCCG